MLTPEEDMEITSLRKRGWSISAIARHIGRDRKTVRAYLSGRREPGVRSRASRTCSIGSSPTSVSGSRDDLHVRATVLFDEVAALGYDRAYPTFTRQLRDRGLRPHCEPCSSTNGRAHVDIEHPAGEEIQWDWLELDDTPWGAKAYVLVGALSHSSRFRAWFSDSDDQAHLVVGIDEVLAPLRRHGAAVAGRSDGHGHQARHRARCSDRSRRWPSTTASAWIRARPGTATAKAWSRRRSTTSPSRGGAPPRCLAVEAQAAGSVLCRVADQRSADPACARSGSVPAGGDIHSPDGIGVPAIERRPSVAELADAEPLLALPAGALPGRGDEWCAPSPPTRWCRCGATATRSHPAWSAATCRSVGGTAPTRSPCTPAAPSSPPTGSRPRARSAPSACPSTPRHSRTSCSAPFTTARPCRRKVNRPPSDAALALAAELLGDRGADPVIDLDVYRRVVDGEDTA